MNRTTTLIALAAGLVSLSFTTTAHADDTPTVNVDATCEGLTVATSGWPEGSDGIVGFGANPPWAAPVNATGTYLGWHPAGERVWNVTVRGPGQVEQVLQGTIDCAETAPDVLVEADPQPVITERPRRQSVDPAGFWADVELAPPW